MIRPLLLLTLVTLLVGTRAGLPWQAQVPDGSQKPAQADAAEADRLYDLAATLFKQEKYDEASAAARRAVEAREKIDRRSADTARALSLLASIECFAGRDDQAEPLYRRAVSIWEKNSAAEPSDYVTALEGYACLLNREKHEGDALKYGRRAGELIHRLSGGAATTKESPKRSEESAVLNPSSTITQPHASESGDDHAPRVAGAVSVQVTVDEAGKVILACSLSGPASIREASERAAYGWRFQPTLLHGEPVKVTGTITFRFEPR